MSPRIALSIASGLCLTAQFQAAAQNVSIVDVPDYSWYAGCFGSASGNLMGYWDRNGFPSFYNGPTSGGVAPLNSNGSNAGVRSMWASKAGFDGRAADQPGHLDDYWDFYVNDFAYSYESAATDRYVLAGRPERAPECLGDFMGSSQNKWSDLDGECSGNIDAFAFNFWEKQGARRGNFVPPDHNGIPVRDIQSGFRGWAQSRGNQAEVFSQLAEFHSGVPAGKGFTFEDLKAEIDAGYPVMLFLQKANEFSRPVDGMARANPHVHGMIAYGYIANGGVTAVRYRTSWASGDNSFSVWGPNDWEAGLTLRGVIGFHPLPQITSVVPESSGIHIEWDGPSSILRDNDSGATTQVHCYVVEKSNSLAAGSFSAVTEASPERQAIVPNSADAHAFYRVRLVEAPSAE